MKRLLTPEQVRSLREEYAALPQVRPTRTVTRIHKGKRYEYKRENKGFSRIGVNSLARKYGILQANIYPIVRRETYADVV